MAVQPAGGWQFVNINEPKKQKKDQVIRKIVRANAMRDFRKKQKEERQTFLQAQSKSHVFHVHATERLDEVSQPHKPPELAANSLYLLPESMAGFLRDERLSEDAYRLCPEELKKLLGNLESLSLAELTMNHEEALVQQARQQGFDPYIAPQWLPMESRPLSYTSSKGFVEQKLMTNPKTLLDSGGDPFDALPISDSPSRYNAYVLHHFVTVMATSALPFDQGSGENPLTKIWLPHALLDTALFLSTLSFAAVHIDMLAGRETNIKSLSHKNETIKKVNEKIQNPKNALSDSSIGAVAMLAATAIMQGNLAELNIHMNALRRMVDLRGGLQQLGWSGVLHMFISWQDLLYSSILAQPPAYEAAPCCLMTQINIPTGAPIDLQVGVDSEISRQFATLFADLHYLTSNLNQAQKQRKKGTALTTLDLMAFSRARTIVERRILAMARSSDQKPRNTMTPDDYAIELCRVAALIYIKCGLHMFLPICTILTALKEQIMQLIRSGEKFCGIGIQGEIKQPGCTIWAMFMGSLLAVTPEEEDFFAKRIAKAARIIGSCTWPDIELRLRRIGWLDKLRTPVCRRIWARVEAINAEDSRKHGTVAERLKQWPALEASL